MFKRIFVTTALLVFLAFTVQAQNPRGSLRGTVQDPTGARIPSARILVRSLDSAVEREAASEDRGEFRLDDLLPGAYHVTVNATGADFAEWVDWPQPLKPEMGSIVNYKGTYVVVSSPSVAAFVGNDTRDMSHAILVAFAGQLPVFVRGLVHEGDLIIANDDGTGFAVGKDEVTLAQSKKAVGTAWQSSEESGLKRVNVAVGIGLGGNGSRDIVAVRAEAALRALQFESDLRAKDEKIRGLENENATIKAYLCHRDPAAPICQ